MHRNRHRSRIARRKRGEVNRRGRTVGGQGRKEGAEGWLLAKTEAVVGSPMEEGVVSGMKKMVLLF